jgi:hypothetical protein
VHPIWDAVTPGASGQWVVNDGAVPNNVTSLANRFDDYDNHLSFNNARPDQAVPFLVDSYIQPGPITKATQGEIFAVATDGSGKIYRFAHSRADINRGGKGYDFWATPRGNVSQDGRFFLFTSNWDCTLPADASGACRTDIFGVALAR